jgi:hypothetical protein
MFLGCVYLRYVEVEVDCIALMQTIRLIKKQPYTQRPISPIDDD